MVLQKDLSIVPDSTADSCSSSPMSNSQIVQRAPRTYGRRKDGADTAIDSTRSVFRTGPNHVDEEVAESSDGGTLPPQSSGTTQTNKDEDTDADDSDGSLPAFQFGWKNDLKAMDDMSDTEVAVLTSKYKAPDASSLSALKDTSTSPGQSSPARGVEEIPFDRDVFSGGLPNLTDTSPSSQSPLNGPRPSPPPPLIRHKTKKRVVIESDSDSEFPSAPVAVQESSPVTPGVLHPITTPDQRSSSTPPTSEGDMPSKKGKGKVPARSVPPLSFVEPLSMSESRSNVRKKDVKGNGKETRPRIKAPTKKAQKETILEQHRINADRSAVVPRENKPLYTLQSLLQKQGANAKANSKPNSKPTPEPEPAIQGPEVDPVEQFTSPATGGGEGAESGSTHSFGAPIHGLLGRRHSFTSSAAHRAPTLPTRTHVNSDEEMSDEDLPEIADMLQERQAKDEVRRRDEEKKARADRLAEAKQRILAQQAQIASRAEDSGDEDELVVESGMQVVADEEAGERRHGHRPKVSEVRKRQLALGRVHREDGTPRRKDKGKMDALQVLMAGTKSVFAKDEDKGKAHGIERMSRIDLNRLLIKCVDADRATVSKKKEEEWERIGGKLLREGGETRDMKAILQEYAERATKAAERRGEMEVDEDDGDDEEWTPEMRGSASPDPQEIEAGSEHESGDEDSGAQDQPTADDEEGEETDDKENFRPRAPRRSAPRPRAVVDSDDDDDDDDVENVRPVSGQFGRVLVPDTSLAEFSPPHSHLPMPAMIHRGSLSSFEEPTEDENDKENDTRLMFDRSEDKENKAVVRYDRPLLGSRSGSLLGLEEGVRRGLSMSPGPDAADLDEKDEQERMPLKELAKEGDTLEEDPFAFTPSRKPASFTSQLQRAGSSELSLAPSPLAFGGGIRSGFSQFDTQENGFKDEAIAPKASLLEPGFADLFESGTAQSSVRPLRTFKAGGYSQLFSSKDKVGFDKLRQPGDPDELALTLDVGLQPALKVDEDLRRRADNIFEKEQEYVAEAATRRPQNEPELYVNDHGFLTQTRPDVSSPEIYRVASPSQMSTVIATQNMNASQPTSQRHPLRTLSVSEDFEDTENMQPLRRLQKRQTSPADTLIDDSGFRASMSPSPQKPQAPKNAFELLLQKAPHAEHLKQRKKLEKSEYVEAEAEESDDDDQLGFGGFRKKGDDGEESDGEDQDAVLTTLVDDAEMDEETQAKELVLEKVKEHLEEDDRALEKLHRDAAEGKLRSKRRDRGIGFEDDSDDDDDDEEARRLRNKMYKKRRIDGDSLEDLQKNEETRAFYEAYQHDLLDDDIEFAHLRDGDVVMRDEQDEENEDPQETVTINEIRQRAREMAQSKELTGEPHDPEDVSWVDEDGSDDESKPRIRVKATSVAPTKQISIRRSGWGQTDFDGPTEPLHRRSVVETPVDRTRLTSWAKEESRSRNMGTGRSAVGAAVTGHSRTKVKTGGGSLRSTHHQVVETGSSMSAGPRKPMKAPSVLANVVSGTSRFA